MVVVARGSLGQHRYRHIGDGLKLPRDRPGQIPLTIDTAEGGATPNAGGHIWPVRPIHSPAAQRYNSGEGTSGGDLSGRSDAHTTSSHPPRAPRFDGERTRM